MPTVRTFSALVALALAGCASEDPWLRPRTPAAPLDPLPAPAPLRSYVPLARLPAPPAPAATALASASGARVPMSLPAGGSSQIDRLNAEERRLWDRMMELREAHDRALALASALSVYEKDRSEHRREQAQRALTAYQGSPAVRKLGAVALGLSLAACNSIGREINSLNAEERELADRIAVLQEARKANIALVTALQQVQRDGGSKSRTAEQKAREAYERAITRVE